MLHGNRGHHVSLLRADEPRPGEPERLFAKFQRGRDDLGAGGAGLGLAIGRVIVNAHGGHITAMQRPGGGARFMFTLPTTAPAP